MITKPTPATFFMVVWYSIVWKPEKDSYYISDVVDCDTAFKLFPFLNVFCNASVIIEA